MKGRNCLEELFSSKPKGYLSERERERELPSSDTGALYLFSHLKDPFHP